MKTHTKHAMLLTLWIACGAIPSSFATTLTVLPTDLSWGNPIGENGGGGSSSITATATRSGNGSLELFGDRTRFFGLGNPYDSGSNLGLLSTVTDFHFDWMVAVGSTQGTTPNYSPALRLHIWDGAQRSELIWENAYNGPTTVTQGDWYTSGSADNFWRYQTGIGDSGIYDRTISQWSTLGYSANAYIAGVSIGVGSSAGAGYHAFADNVTLAFGATSTTYNFEVPEAPASVPDGGKTLMLLGTALIGCAVMRQGWRVGASGGSPA